MNNNDINELLKKSGKGSRVDASKLKQAAQNGDLGEYIKSTLSNDVSSKVEEVLSDKEKTKKLLSSPQAKELMKKLGIK